MGKCCEKKICCVGPAGPTGPAGQVGPMGPTGGGFIPSYGYFYNNSSGVQVSQNSDFPMNSNGPMTGMFHLAGPTGDTGVTVLNTGVYQVTYMVIGGDDTTSIGLGLTLSGTLQSQTQIKSNTGVGTLSGVAILQITGNTILTIRNTGPTLVLNTNAVSVQLVITRIS